MNLVDYYNMGIIFGEQGNYNEAVKAFDYVLQHDPKDAEAWNNRGACLIELERYTEAEQSFENALKIRPDYEAAKENMFKCRIFLGKTGVKSWVRFK
jgi:Flp pilus assembly protein TadD